MTRQGPMHIVCPHCQSVNRIPEGRDAAAAKCGKCGRALFVGEPAAATGDAFRRHVERNEIPVLVDFWADWCGPCHAMAPSFAAAAKAFEPRLRFLKLDTEAEPAVANRYGIRSIPTLILFRRGAPAAQQVGAVSGGALNAWIAAQLGAAARETQA